jgi:uncharacterized membrane protein
MLCLVTTTTNTVFGSNVMFSNDDNEYSMSTELSLVCCAVSVACAAAAISAAAAGIVFVTVEAAAAAIVAAIATTIFAVFTVVWAWPFRNETEDDSE